MRVRDKTTAPHVQMSIQRAFTERMFEGIDV